MPDQTNPPATDPAIDPNDLLAMHICQQGLKNIQDSRAAKERDFLAYQTCILTGQPMKIVQQELPPTT